MPWETDLIMFSPLHTLVSDLSRPRWITAIQTAAFSRWGVHPLFMIKYKYSQPLHSFLSVHFQFLFPLIPVDYLQCSEYTHSLCLFLSWSLIFHHCRLYRLPPSWPQPACFLITLMSKTCKDIISLKCLLLVLKKKKRRKRKK